MNTIKILFLSLIFTAPLLLSACGSGGGQAGSNEGINSDITFSTLLPKSLQKHRTDLIVELVAVHQESGELRTTQLTINDAHQVSEKPGELKVSGKISELKPGSYVFTTTYRLNGVVVGTQTTTGVVEGNNSTSISFNELTLPDNDKDGLTNLKEAVNGTDPDDPGSPEQSVSIRRDISSREAGLPFNFTVSLSKPNIEELTVEYATQNNTAIDGLDYSATSGVLTFGPGVNEQSINITILDDTTDEAEETFYVALSNPSANTTIFDGTRMGTIADDDGLPTVSISDIEPVLEAGGLATFTVSLSNAISEVVTVDFSTGNLSASAGTDYTEKAGTLIFDPGVTQRTIEVTVRDDGSDESEETFNITLSNPSTNITIVNGTGLGTIVDNDGLPTVSISDTEPALETGGLATFTVSLSNAINEVVTVDFRTGNLSAVAGTDYTETTGTLTFDPGVTELAVDIVILDDPTDEPEETFNITLSNSSTNATIVNGIGVGTIADDDGLPTVSMSDTEPILEAGGIANFNVSLSNEISEVVTVDFSTGNLSAVAGTDYTETSGTLTFDPGVTELALEVNVLDDTIDEPKVEVFSLMLSNSSANATIVDDILVATIADDDAPTVSIDNPALVIESGGLVTFTVSLSKITSETVTVDFSAGDLSASAGSDYTLKSGTLTFDPGVTRQTVTVMILDDNIVEPKETFNVTLSNASANATMLDDTGVAIIRDDDWYSFRIMERPYINEGVGTINFPVFLSTNGNKVVTVEYTTSNGTAIAGRDYMKTSGTLTFQPGVSVQNIKVIIVNAPPAKAGGFRLRL